MQLLHGSLHAIPCLCSHQCLPEQQTWSREFSKQRVALLTKLGRGTRWEEALALVADHALHGPRLDVFACGASIRACELSAQWEVALALLSLGTRSRVVLNDVAYNTAINVCDKAKKWSQARRIVQDMEDHQVQTDVITWSALVSAYAKGQKWEAALEVLHMLPSIELEPNQMTYSAAISACAAAEPWPWAVDTLRAMQEQNLEADSVVQTAILTACGFGAKWEECISIAAGMGERPRQITCNALMASLQRAAQWTQVLTVLSDMQSQEGRWKNCTIDAFSCSAAIAACGTGGHWQAAVKLFTQSRLQTTVLLNVAIVACGENFQWQQVLVLLGHFRASHFFPDTISYNSAITACQVCAQWREAEAILEEMTRQAHGVASAVVGLYKYLGLYLATMQHKEDPLKGVGLSEPILDTSRSTV